MDTMIVNSLISDLLDVVETVDSIDATSKDGFTPVVQNNNCVALVTPSNLRVITSQVTLKTGVLNTRVILPLEIWVKYIPSQQAVSVPLVRGIGESVIYKLYESDFGDYIINPEVPLEYTIAPNLFEGEHSTPWFVGTVSIEFVYRVTL